MTPPGSQASGINPTTQARRLSAMHEAADLARRTTLAHFRQSLQVDNKEAAGGFDPVTQADREAEIAIRGVLTRAFPDYGFLGEEHAGVTTERADAATWVVDPIDGTRAYITGLPLWGTLIALHADEDVVLGMLDQPFLGERFVGIPGLCEVHTADGVRRLQTRQDRTLRESILQTTTPEMFTTDDTRRGFELIAGQVAMTRYGGDCYAYALLAMGFVDIVIESDLKPYDVQAVIAIVRGAGGLFTDWEGQSAAQGGSVVASASPQLHADVLARLAAR